MSAEILKPIADMSDEELLAVLTVNRDNFNDEHKVKVAEELMKRGVDLEEKFKKAKYNFNLQEIKEIDIYEAYEKISILKTSLDVLYFFHLLI